MISRMGLRDYFERRRTQREVAKYLTPEFIKRAEGIIPKKPEVKHFQFVIVGLEVGTPDQVSELLENVAQEFHRFNAGTFLTSPTLVIGYLGVPFQQYDSPETRRALVKALLARNGKRVRVMHGECNAPVGNLGGKGHFVYGAILPNFAANLRKLLDQPFGTAVEVK
jgi:hypothetical protein